MPPGALVPLAPALAAGRFDGVPGPLPYDESGALRVYVIESQSGVGRPAITQRDGAWACDTTRCYSWWR